MKKISLIIVGLIVLIVGAGATAISMIDWNDYKKEVAQKISEVTDKKVIFDGDISLSLFPYPYLNAQNVRVVDNTPNGQRNLAQIKSLVVKVDLMSLLAGEMEMQRVALVEPRIDFEVMKNEQLNWYSPMSYERREKLLLMDISLESVTIEKGIVVFRDDKRGINALYNKFNAEIIADNIFGPYRIEGSFVKDERPAGFAVSIGGFSESSTTDVSLVLTQPAAEASMMFNGVYNVATMGNSLNGDITFEVQKLNEFLDIMVPGTKIDSKYDMPVALTSTAKVNKSKINLSNMIIKYGKSAGAGKADIIFAKEKIEKNGDEKLDDKVKINSKLEFSSFDFEPLIYTMKNFYETHKDGTGKFELPKEYELSADVAISESIYNSGKIKDAKFNVRIDEEQIKISDLGVMLPGASYFTADGFMKPQNNVLYYDVDLNVNSTRTNTLFKWLGFNLHNPTNSLYKAASFKGKLNGSFNDIKMNKINFVLDRTSFDGDVNIKTGKRNYFFVDGKVDNFNFDSYLPKTPEKILAKSFKERVDYKFSKIAYLNDFNADIKLKSDLFVYGQLPLENFEVSANLKNGVLLLNKFSIPNAAGLKFDASGVVKGFGEKPYFKKIKYELDAKDIANLCKRIKIEENEFFVGKKLMSKGEFTGDFNKFSLKSSSIIGDIKLQNAGVFEKTADDFKYNAVIKFEHKNFLNMLKEFDVEYNPNALSLGIFRINGKAKGNLKKIDIQSLKASIGTDSFEGKLNLDLSLERPVITSDLKIDNFQVGRYLSKNIYKEVENKKTKKDDGYVQTISKDAITFLNKPEWHNKEIDYSLFSKFDIKSDLQFGKLSYGKYNFDRFVTKLDLTNSILKLSGIKTEHNGAFILSDLEFSLSGEPSVKGNVKLDNYKVSSGFDKNKIYDFQTDVFNTDFTFDAKITSSEKFVKSLNAKGKFETEKIIIKGLNLTKISKSINSIKKSKDVEKLIKDNLSKGSDVFVESFGEFEISRGKAKFKDLFFDSEDVTLTINNTSVLNMWNLDADMVALFVKFPKLPKLEISMKDSLSNPTLGYDYSKVEGYYKAIEDKEAKRIQDEINRKKAELRRFTSEKIRVITSHKKDIKELLEDMKTHIINVKDESILSKVKRATKLHDTLLSNISLAEKIDRKPEITEDLFHEVEGYMLENNRLILDYKADIEDVVFSSLRLKARNNMSLVSDKTTRASKIINEYRMFETDKIKKLNQLNRTLSFKNDKDFVEKNRLYNVYVDELYSQNDLATSDFDRSQKSRIVDEMKLYIVNLDDYANSISKSTNEVEKIIVDLKNLMNATIDKELEAQKEVKKKEEIERKVKESKGSLSVRGKTQKFGLTKEEVTSSVNGKIISNDNQASVDNSNQEEPVMILDFSKKDNKNQEDKNDKPKIGKVYRF